MKITLLQEDKENICEEILLSLPEWFGIPEAIESYKKAVVHMPTLLATIQQEIAGFLSLKIHNEFSAEIYVMGVKKEFHRQGVGASLIKESERFLQKKHTKFFTVKTLSPSRESPEYEKTRKFYRSMGFYPLEEFPTLWGEANPCLFLAKTL